MKYLSHILLLVVSLTLIYTCYQYREQAQLLKRAAVNEAVILSCLNQTEYYSVTTMEKPLGFGRNWTRSTASRKRFKRNTITIVNDEPKILQYEGETYDVKTKYGTLVVEERREVGDTDYKCRVVGFNLTLTGEKK
jgi:hypothetical protein